MKGKAILALVVLGAWQTAQAEPVFMPQAQSVLKAKQAEAGVAGHFGYQSSEIIGSEGTTYINRVWMIPFFARYGITDHAEAGLSLPVTRAVDSSEGLASSHNANTGIGNMQLGAKWNFASAPVPMAAALNVDLPTANARNNPAALGQRYSIQQQQGFNAHLQFLADSPIVADMLIGHAALGYMNTATWTNPSNSRFNPSDLMTFGASVECRLNRWVPNLSVSGEMVGNTGLTHARSNGTVQGNDLGTVLEVGPAVRYQAGSVRTFAGFLVDEGKTAFRAYNYRVNFGLSVLIGGH